MYWTYHTLTRSGEEVTGLYEGRKSDALAYIKENQWELICLKANYMHALKQIWCQQSLNSETLAVFFMDFHNMFLTGMTVNQIITALSETVANPALKAILARTQEALLQGESLSKALGQERAMPWIVRSTLYTGERSGRLKEIVAVLGDYFKRQGDIKNKMINASVYPLIVFVFLVSVMLFVSLKVVPKLQVLLPSTAMENPATRCVLILSAVLQKTWGICLALGVIGGFAIYHYYKEHRYELEELLYRVPLLGEILKETAFSFYFLNLSVLLKSGMPLMKALGDLEACLTNSVSHRFLICRDYMLGGSPFWEALAKDNFFPLVIVHTLRRGEESAKIDVYCENLTAYFHQRSQTKVDQMVHLVQPILLGMGGLFLVVIAFAFLIPIYGSLTKIAGG